MSQTRGLKINLRPKTLKVKGERQSSKALVSEKKPANLDPEASAPYLKGAALLSIRTKCLFYNGLYGCLRNISYQLKIGE
jgi:hypothetical protein